MWGAQETTILKASILTLAVLLLPALASAEAGKAGPDEQTNSWMWHCKHLVEWDYVRKHGWWASVERDARSPVLGVDYTDGVDADEALVIAERWVPEITPYRHTLETPKDEGPVWGIQIIMLGVLPSSGGHVFVHKQTGAVSFGSGPTYASHLDRTRQKEGELNECLSRGWTLSDELPYRWWPSRFR